MVFDREMLLNCAKALFELEQENSYHQHVTNPIMFGIKGKVSWDYITDDEKVVVSVMNGYVKQAEAVIKALREPTERMCSAGAMELPDYDPSNDDAKRCWQNMIDKILNP